MADRRPYLAANWKMNKTIEEAEAFIGEFLPTLPDIGGPEVAICPSFMILQSSS